ncbi:hypothetical protein B7L18_030950 [Burkholderia cenocepacia]|uniref:hypothetical protein n=1 Tax=Burkholderia cenocepacia TaxID=95486 RepID=UPI0022384A60|nr:hypothetical protein [Burkholderia cenocepacia]MCW5127198.1 hypothetical protein [Burkholderia cenocepacia]
MTLRVPRIVRRSIQRLPGLLVHATNRKNLSAFLWARRLNNRLSTRLRESLAEQDSKLVHR